MSQSACAVWDFRANEETYTQPQLQEFFEQNAKKWTFQLEQGDTGYRHWQGRFSLIKKRTKQPLLKLFPGAPPQYLAPTATDNHLEEHFYAQKADTRVEGPWSDGGHELSADYEFISDQANVAALRPWQLEIMASADVFDPRTIDVVYDPLGNHGKSVLCEQIRVKRHGIQIPAITDPKQIIEFALCLCYEKTRRPGLVIVDLPRAMNKKFLDGLFGALEQIKSGYLTDLRHRARVWQIHSPRIWVFTNSLPDAEYLSPGRMKIWQITELSHRLVPYSPNNPSPEYPLV